VVRAAFRGLGSAISKLEIERLMKAAVETRPDAVLEIVRVAVEETPPQLHPNIVSAAVASVPDPYVRVRVRRLQERPYFDSVRFGDETFDGKSFGEGKGPPGEEVLGYDRVMLPTASRWLRQSWEARLRQARQHDLIFCMLP